MNKIIETEKINLYIKKKKLKNIVVFLTYITKNGVNDFLDFIKLPAVEGGVLLHGSTKAISELDISKTNTFEEFNYATNNPNYAIFLAIIDLNENGQAGVNISKKEYYLSKGFINGDSKIVNGFVHVITKKGFKSSSNSEFVSKNKTNIIFSIPVSIDDMPEKIIVKH